MIVHRYASATDASVAAAFNPGWVRFDVTARVPQWSGAVATKFGWRVKQTTSGSNYKQLATNACTTDPRLRPKLSATFSEQRVAR